MDPKIALEFERSIKVLKRSKLTKTPEFNDMVLASERFYRDARLASLTRKDHNQINQQLEDAQFFSILLGMLGEVAKSAGLKQRDDLRKVYHWYQLNKAVLHCQPHFQSVSTPPNQKPPELKFSPEVIKYYSIPPEKRKAKQVGFEDSKNSSISVQGNDAFRRSSTKSPTPRPVTAPPVLNRPKVENTLPPGPKSWKGQQYYIEDSGLSISYINKHLTPKKYMAALDRPSSAMAVVRQYQQSLPDSYEDDDGLSSDGRVSPLSSTLITGMGSQSNVAVEETVPEKDPKKYENQRYYVEKDEDEDKISTVDASDENNKEPVKRDSEEGEDSAVPPPCAETPVTQHSFVDDEIFGDGDPPDEKKYQMKKIEVNLPAVGDDSSSLASQMNLQKWQDYQQSHSTFQSHSAVTNNNEGAFQSETMVVEMPEMSTDEVIANYAENMGPPIAPDSSKFAPAQPLEDFYEATEKFSPAVNAKKPILKKPATTNVSQTKPSDDKKLTKVYVPNEVKADVKISNALNESSSSQGVHLDSVVDLAGPISDQMVVERESQQEPVEPRLRHRQPAALIPSPRPHTALGHSSSTHIKIPDGRNRTSPANTPRSSFGSEGSPRSSTGDMFVGFPLKSEYDVHFRRKARPLTAPTHIPYAIQHAPIRPDTTRYRSKSASPKSLRTAGSSSAGGRPRTASSLSGQMWNSNKPIGTKVRVPGAASHSASTIHPLTISALMSVRYLGGSSSNFREELSPRARRYWNDEDIPVDLPPNLEFMTISKPAHVYETKTKDESAEEKVAPTPPAETQESTHPPEIPNWSSPQDSIEGLVQMGRARSERGGGDVDSQNGGSLDGSSERGFSPEPADLSDVEDDTRNEVPLVTPRENDTEEGNIEKLEKVAHAVEAEGVKDGGLEEDKLEESKNEDESQSVDVGGDGTIGGEGEVSLEREENEIEKEEEDRDEQSKDGDENEGVEEGGDSSIFGERKVFGEKEVNEDEKACGERVNGEEKVVGGGEEAAEELKTLSDKNLEGVQNDESKERNHEGEPSGDTKCKDDEKIEDGSSEVTDTGGDGNGTVREGKDSGAEAEVMERSESKGTAIFESVDDEDYLEPPLIHFAKGNQSYQRHPQFVIPKVRNSNGQLEDAGLGVFTNLKPLTPRDEKSATNNSVTICGTRPRHNHSRRKVSSIYLFTEEEPSEAELSQKLKADVRKKPLNERTRRWPWRLYRASFPHYRTVAERSEFVSKYRVALAGLSSRSDSPESWQHFMDPPYRMLEGFADQDALGGAVPRRPQTPKRFEILPPKPIKPITEEWQGRPVPEVFGTLDEEEEKKAYERKKAARKAVDISELFSKKTDRKLLKMQKELEWSRWERRWEEADAAERNHFMHLTRKKQSLLHHSGVMEEDWEAEYLSQRKLLQKMKKKEKRDAWKKRNKMAAKEKAYLSRIGASLDIWGAFREGKRGTTKAQRKAAAIMIQKHVRGWLARRKFQKIKEKSRVHASSYTGFVKYYSKLMTKVARWHGVKTPIIHIELKQVEDFMDKKRYFENVFARRAFPKRTIEYQELAGFFRECDLYPTQREMYNAVLGVTRKTPDNPKMALTEQQVAEIAFMIYVPDGTGLDKTKTRKSTWLNPLIDGKEANKFIGSKEYHNAKLSATMALVFSAHKDRKDKEEAEMRKLKEDGEDDGEEDEDTLPKEERKKKQLEDWLRKERERERLEEEKRSRPTRNEEIVTYYQRGEEGLVDDIE